MAKQLAQEELTNRSPERMRAGGSRLDNSHAALSLRTREHTSNALKTP